MADAVTFNVESRDPKKNRGTGSRVARKLRAQGRVPAIIYGHKEAPVPISISSADVQILLRRGPQLTKLQIGDRSEMTLIRDVQWDYLGKEIIHLDFFRVSAEDQVTTEVPLELHGTSPGVSEGGVLAQTTHELPITCQATAIPESIRVDISELQIDEIIHVSDLELPEGVTTEADPTLVIVHVTPRREEPVEEELEEVEGEEPTEAEDEAQEE